jgi:hypothetical protein
MRPARQRGSRPALPEKCRQTVFAASLHEFPDFPNALTVLFTRSRQMTMDLHSLSLGQTGRRFVISPPERQQR